MTFCSVVFCCVFLLFHVIVVHGWKIDSRTSPEPPGSSQSPKTNLQNFENSEHSKIWVWWAAGGFVIKFVFFVCFFKGVLFRGAAKRSRKASTYPGNVSVTRGSIWNFLIFDFQKSIWASRICGCRSPGVGERRSPLLPNKLKNFISNLGGSGNSSVRLETSRGREARRRRTRATANAPGPGFHLFVLGA